MAQFHPLDAEIRSDSEHNIADVEASIQRAMMYVLGQGTVRTPDHKSSHTVGRRPMESNATGHLSPHNVVRPAPMQQSLQTLLQTPACFQKIALALTTPRPVEFPVERKHGVTKKKSKGINTTGSLIDQVQKARQQLQSEIECANNADITSRNFKDVLERVNSLEKTVAVLCTKYDQLEALVRSKLNPSLVNTPSTSASQPTATSDDEVDLFASTSDHEDEEAVKLRESRVAAYNAKKAKKAPIIAKSSVILDVKPWDDQTNMKDLEANVRKHTQDGLLWGASKLVPLAYGIYKLQINCVIEDEKVSVDALQEVLETDFADYVQSVDVAAFNKI